MSKSASSNSGGGHIPGPVDNGASTARGRFQPGNPGRRPGSKNRRTALLEQMAQQDGAAVLRAVIDAAMKGDLVAARLVLERIYPAPKGRRIGIDLPPVTSAADLIGAFNALVAALAKGELATDEAAAVANVLESNRRMMETADIERRVAALEQQRGTGP